VSPSFDRVKFQLFVHAKMRFMVAAGDEATSTSIERCLRQISLSHSHCFKSSLRDNDLIARFN
jgi:hypothetical protein